MANILITGCPGVGKSTVASLVADKTGLFLINVGDVVKAERLYEEWDDELQTFILDEPALISYLEPKIEERGVIVDFHSPAVFSSDWFDLVVVLTCINDILYPRLEQRGYSEAKIQDNIEAEIMEVVLDEAMDIFEDKVVRFPCETLDQVDDIVNYICSFVNRT
ncbi:hypothetical protein RCL1_003836 [Eukaryota sp. TZLM3-RCL]